MNLPQDWDFPPFKFILATNSLVNNADNYIFPVYIVPNTIREDTTLKHIKPGTTVLVKLAKDIPLKEIERIRTSKTVINAAIQYLINLYRTNPSIITENRLAYMSVIIPQGITTEKTIYALTPDNLHLHVPMPNNKHADDSFYFKYMRLPNIGDTVPDNIIEHLPLPTAQLHSSLKPGNILLIKRSGNKWTYAVLQKINNQSLICLMGTDANKQNLIKEVPSHLWTTYFRLYNPTKEMMIVNNMLDADPLAAAPLTAAPLAAAPDDEPDDAAINREHEKADKIRIINQKRLLPGPEWDKPNPIQKKRPSRKAYFGGKSHKKSKKHNLKKRKSKRHKSNRRKYKKRKTRRHNKSKY